jgi:hypothetical protein
MKPEDRERDPGFAIGAKILGRYMLRERIARERFDRLDRETARFEAAMPGEEESIDLDIEGLDPCPDSDPDIEYSRIMQFEGNLKRARENPISLLRKIAKDF